MSEWREPNVTAEKAQLVERESLLADRLFGIIEATLRIGVTSDCRGYDPKVVAKRLTPILEIVRSIDSLRQAKRKETTP